MVQMPKDNVILLPKTVDYYQAELTRLLEMEQYTQAGDLLRFLLQCQSDDPQTVDEWGALLKWLENAFQVGHGGADDNEWTETDLLKEHLKEKVEKDPQYVLHLMNTLAQMQSPENTLSALEQLAIAEHPDIGTVLKEWLVREELPPLVQFRTLQVLKQKGVTGQLELSRYGRKLRVNIANTPLNPEEFPKSAANIMQQIGNNCEIHQPSLAELARQAWVEFFSAIYGTPAYEEISHADQALQQLCACALYHVVLESVLGPSDEHETMEIFGVSEDQLEQWLKVYASVKNAYFGMNGEEP